MMSPSLFLLQMTSFFYASSFFCHCLSFFGDKPGMSRVAFHLMRIGFLVSTLFFMAEAVNHSAVLPVYQFSQAMSFFAWSLAFVYIALFAKIQNEPFGLVLTPFLFLLSMIACFYFYADIKPATVELNIYFALHIVSVFFAYACLTISFSASLLYLSQQRALKKKKAGTFYHKLPSLEALEKLIFEPMLWGAGLLAIAIMIGFLWSKSSVDQDWHSVFKTISTYFTISFYALILGLYYLKKLRGKKVVVMSLFAFGVLIFSFIGMRLVESIYQWVS
jgi:ABC-type uncharacterized transport system permease subunit